MPYKKKADKVAPPAPAPTSLGDLLDAHGSDKNTVHSYGPVYDLIFAQQLVKNRPLKVLEIGIYKGASLQAFASLPYVQTVVGIDNAASGVAEPQGLNIDKVKAYWGAEFDAYCDDTLQMLLDIHGKFDVIIDDGPHSWDSQVWFFKNYDTLLNDGGVLVCEDIWERHIERLASLKKELDVYIIDLRLNKNAHHNEIIALKYKHQNAV